MKREPLNGFQILGLMIFMIFIVLPLGIGMIALSGEFIILPMLDLIGK